jgi:hypothetical protein
MDNDRPALDLKHFDKIFPDEGTNGMSKLYELGINMTDLF